MESIASHAGSDAAHERSAQVLANATTALMGRVNYEGFHGYWPPVAEDETADERDRAIARWLDEVEKIVFSTTMTDAPWANSRIANHGPVEEVKRMRDIAGGDILVVNSSSIIRQLIAVDELDRLVIDLVPEIAGDGARLFEDGPAVVVVDALGVNRRRRRRRAPHLRPELIVGHEARFQLRQRRWLTRPNCPSAPVRLALPAAKSRH